MDILRHFGEKITKIVKTFNTKKELMEVLYMDGAEEEAVQFWTTASDGKTYVTKTVKGNK